jgi:hypothetical protein
MMLIKKLMEDHCGLQCAELIIEDADDEVEGPRAGYKALRGRKQALRRHVISGT